VRGSVRVRRAAEALDRRRPAGECVPAARRLAAFARSGYGPEGFDRARRMPRTQHQSRIARVCAAFGVPLLAGWLASGSCTVVACYEECDPCFQQCKCSSNCQNHLAGEGGFRIVASDARVATDGEGRTLRTFSAIVGPELSGADDGCDAERVAAFARTVLEVNAARFTARRAATWQLDAVQPVAGGAAATFHLVPGRLDAPARANSITLFLDPRGRLVQIDQVFDRGNH
jgi:hypothetical protein